MSTRADLASAETLCTEYEAELLGAIVSLLESSLIEAPWAAVSIAYHHGLSFDCVLGVLPAKEWLEFNDSGVDTMEAMNPAEWEHYDEAGLFIEVARVTELARELESLVGNDVTDVPRYARRVFSRVATAVRAELTATKRLQADGVVYATDYAQCDLRENAAESNPSAALARFRIT